jgi:hypothetical protein
MYYHRVRNVLYLNKIAKHDPFSHSEHLFPLQNHPRNARRKKRGPLLLNGWSGEHFDVSTDALYTDEELNSMSNRRLLQLADEHFRPFQTKDFVWREINGRRVQVRGLGEVNVNILPRIHK